MPGILAANLKEGSRSEILADYLFSQWGAVTPVRTSDDIGVDLYCTLCDRIGRRAVVRDYFTVQVKSGTVPPSWVLKGQAEVKWLIEYPSPFFLAWVEKEKGTVSVYHLMPRFHVWALGRLPKRLELRPEQKDDGEFIGWGNGETFSLSAPIIRASCTDLTNEDTMKTLGHVLQSWVSFDRENCDLVRQGLLRFRMPHSYRVNKLPNAGIGELGYAVPEPQFLQRGILRLAEGAECIGGQLFRHGDRHGALRAALLVYHLWKSYSQVFKDQPRWAGSISGDIALVFESLNNALKDRDGSNYAYRGIDEVGKTLRNDPLVKTFEVKGKK